MLKKVQICKKTQKNLKTQHIQRVNVVKSTLLKNTKKHETEKTLKTRDISDKFDWRNLKKTWKKWKFQEKVSENQEYNENISPVLWDYTENLPRFPKNFTINAKKRIFTKIGHKSHTPESCVKLRKIRHSQQNTRKHV